MQMLARRIGRQSPCAPKSGAIRARSCHSSTARKSPESGLSNDCNSVVPVASEFAVLSVYGNFNSRSIAWKRGSLRSGSRSGSVFVYTNPGSRSRMAFSSQSKAVLRSPHWA
jgi:hypothetical protein